MILLKRLWGILLLGTLQSVFGAVCHGSNHRVRGEPLQDLVSWDSYSIMVRGERLMFHSGEFHPFRLPSPGLWLDVLQKIKSLGFSGVSFYVNWALIEGEQGEFGADGVFALEEFFDAASQAGIYLLARPGPYINSEVAGGGFPGWTSRLKGPVRSNATDWLDATRNYIQQMGAIISKAQITNGGPVILFQPENEYTLCYAALGNVTRDNMGDLSKCLNRYYMADVGQMWRDSGITVPFIVNDATPIGNFAPGSGVGAGDMYGFDAYPLGLGTCSDPTNWNRSNANFLTAITNYTIHMQMSPSSPFSIIEYQGGSNDPWGGVEIDSCVSLTNEEFERVYYKLAYGLRATILNLYMTFGGTNWGNIGHPLGYTSYDHGAVIAEDRQVNREKYSELKLQAHFLRASPSYLTSIPDNGTFGVYTNTSELVTTRLASADHDEGDFYIVRHSDWISRDTLHYSLTLEAGGETLTLPQMGGHLTLTGRDSKVHVADYDVGVTRLVYSTAEVFTWRKSSSKTLLVLYGGANETHEFAVTQELGPPTRFEGDGVRSQIVGSLNVIQWDVSPSRRVAHFGDALEVHLLWRNTAYNYWAIDLPQPDPIGQYSSLSTLTATDTSVIVHAGYLLRNASVSQGALYLSGDVNVSTSLEVILSPLGCNSALYFNGEEVQDASCIDGRLTGTVCFDEPSFALPDLSSADWKYVDSLPELQAFYDDKLWTLADKTETNNTRNLTTPTSLYASDYGFHAGSLIYRGHFTATGDEDSFFLATSGGNAFGNSVWLNSTYLGSWAGDPNQLSYNQTFSLASKLQEGQHYVITVLIDHMGLSMNTYADVESIKEPRGILDYNMSGHMSQSDTSWRLTGNLGGEHYLDLSRGPRNEGAMFAERQGYHLPHSPLKDASAKSPITDGIPEAGVGFFATTFDLNLPTGYDIPLSLVFANTTGATNETQTSPYRVQVFVNGWQFGELVSNLGPQLAFPIPEGIWNYNGENLVALTLWALGPAGAKLDGLSLQADAVIQSGYTKPALVQGQTYASREEAY